MYKDMLIRDIRNRKRGKKKRKIRIPPSTFSMNSEYATDKSYSRVELTTIPTFAHTSAEQTLGIVESLRNNMNLTYLHIQQSSHHPFFCDKHSKNVVWYVMAQTMCVQLGSEQKRAKVKVPANKNASKVRIMLKERYFRVETSKLKIFYFWTGEF